MGINNQEFTDMVGNRAYLEGIIMLANKAQMNMASIPPRVLSSMGRKLSWATNPMMNSPPSSPASPADESLVPCILAILKLSGSNPSLKPADFTIHEGLSGIVGPNGCGKSNIVEAMRWLMGESSAKSMRGGELDDVIFAGTAQRPQRNFAEVTLTIDNSDGTIESYANEAQIEISRRLDRGKGSSYRINGKPVRGRDVQLFFADLGTGARAHGIVSQGKVGNLINAKPSDRRGLIEEAANTKGLQHRRHEANLRLNTAERNLIRVDDVIEQMNEQKSALAQTSPPSRALSFHQ